MDFPHFPGIKFERDFMIPNLERRLRLFTLIFTKSSEALTAKKINDTLN